MGAMATCFFLTSIAFIIAFIYIRLPSFSASDLDPSDSDESSENSGTRADGDAVISRMAIGIASSCFLFGVLCIILRKLIDCGYLGFLRIDDPTPSGGGTRRPKVAQGLSPAAVQSIPTYFYKDVKMHRRLGKGEIECAVCLSQFQDHETLRLLPKCSHVFHPDCVDPWLLVHATCPICRTVVSSSSDSKAPDEHQDHVITIDSSNHSRPSEPGLPAVDSTGSELQNRHSTEQTPSQTGHIESRFTLVLPDEEAANSMWQLRRARSQTKGFRESFSLCGRVDLNGENNPDRLHAHSASPLSDTASGYASS